MVYKLILSLLFMGTAAYSIESDDATAYGIAYDNQGRVTVHNMPELNQIITLYPQLIQKNAALMAENAKLMAELQAERNKTCNRSHNSRTVKFIKDSSYKFANIAAAIAIGVIIGAAAVYENNNQRRL